MLFFLRLYTAATLFLPLLSISTTQAASHGPLHCQAQFEILVHQGTPLSPSEASLLELYDPHADYFKLGSGAEGEVYRVIPKTPGRDPYQLKQYRDPHQRDRDFQALKLLEKYAGPEVHIVRPKIYGKNSLRLRNVRGQNLLQVLQGQDASNAEKERLLQNWNQFISHLHNRLAGQAEVKFLQKENKSRFSETPSLVVHLEDEGFFFDLWLKIDNVIVEAGTGRLILIDPF